MEIITLSFVENKEVVQAVICFEYKGKQEHTVCRINLNNNDVIKLNDLLDGLDFSANCEASINERKRSIDTPSPELEVRERVKDTTEKEEEK